MKKRVELLAIAGFAALALSGPMAVRADEDHDHDRARDLYEHGEIRALSEILRIVRDHAPGDIVALDLVRLGEKWIYRFQIVGPDGRRTTVDVDAEAGTVVRNGTGD
jgi:uncharacterized membrane protein YkoI